MKKRNLISLLITVIVGMIIYFVVLPPINITSIAFWVYILLMFAIYLFFNTVSNIDQNGINFDFKKSRIIIVVLVSIPFLIIITNFILSPIFNASAYSKRINVIEDTEESNFTTEIEEVNFKSLPLLDKDSSSRLGDRVMGQMPELVSQFYVSSLYTQINYNNDIIRVTPLEYNGLFKYLTNYKEGVKGYITVNSVDGTANLVKLDKGM